MRTGECWVCGKPVPPGPNEDAGPRLCSPACKDQYQRIEQIPKAPRLLCHRCGCPDLRVVREEAHPKGVIRYHECRHCGLEAARTIIKQTS